MFNSGRVRAGHLGGPRGGQAAAGVAPQPDRRRRRQTKLLGAQRGAQPVKEPVARLIGCAQGTVRSLMVWHRHRPALGQRRGDEEELELRKRARRQRPPAQRVRREAARRHGVDRALIRQHGADLLVAAFGGRDHRGDGCLGLAIHVGGAVQQLRGGEFLRDQPEKCHLDVATAQDGARRGVLEALREGGRRDHRQAGADGRPARSPRAVRSRSTRHRLPVRRCPDPSGHSYLRKR